MNKKRRRELLWFMIPGGAVILAFLINFFVIINAKIPSGSMEPVIQEGALVLGSRLAYLDSEPKPGDVVIFTHEEFRNMLLIKRVIAVGGQRFMMRNGVVYIDGEPVAEEYVSCFSDDDYPEITVPAGMVIVLGDNRTASRDSRYWNNPFVLTENIKAKAVFTYYPEFKKFS